MEYLDLILSVSSTFMLSTENVMFVFLFPLSAQDYKEGIKVMCVELVANRFLRKVIQQSHDMSTVPTFCVLASRSSYDYLFSFHFNAQMVRVLVGTAIREAAAGAGDDALLKLMEGTDRRATAPPAPPEGLCLVDVGYEDFDKQRCFIID